VYAQAAAPEKTYAEKLGLGAITGIDLPGEKVGWISGEDAYNIRFARRGWRWTGGLVLDLAIGQAQVVTPIQLACMVGGLGNSQHIYKPMHVKEERNANGQLVNIRQTQIKTNIGISDSVVPVMREALESVVLAGGTGGRAAVPGISVGGKTGSSQNPQGDKTHALFVGCAPVDNPVIAIAVVVENAGHGGSIAAPIAGDVMRYFFSETEEGKRIYNQYNPSDTTIIKKLHDQVQPMKMKLDSVFSALQ
jgi:penicillin-binding protein 2